MGEKIGKFGKRILELRKQKGWSQPDIAKKIGTSGPIIGRYERGEMNPSIEVAKKFADTFGVTLDYLIADHDVPNILQNKTMLERWKAIDTLPAKDREQILSVLDSLIRDSKARQTYTAHG